MRAVERTPWATRRTSKHDEMCAAIVARPDAFMWWFDSPAVGRVLVEVACGTGYADIVIESPDGSTAWLVEVKTAAENASAGDIIRQLKWYRSHMKRYNDVHLACLTEECLCRTEAPAFNTLMKAADVRVVHYPCMLHVQRTVIDDVGAKVG